MTSTIVNFKPADGLTSTESGVIEFAPPSGVSRARDAVAEVFTRLPAETAMVSRSDMFLLMLYEAGFEVTAVPL